VRKARNVWFSVNSKTLKLTKKRYIHRWFWTKMQL
jgi:hypothetical protein